MRWIVMLALAACGSKTDAASSSTAEVSATSSATAVTATATASAAATAAALVDSAPLGVRAARNNVAHGKAVGLDPEANPTLPYTVLKAYADNTLKADATYKDKPLALGGDANEIGRDSRGRAYVIFDDNTTNTPERQLELKLRKVRIFLAEGDQVSADVAAVLNKDQTILAVCGKGLGVDDEYATFENCSIWSDLRPKSATSASAQPAKR